MKASKQDIIHDSDFQKAVDYCFEKTVAAELRRGRDYDSIINKEIEIRHNVAKRLYNAYGPSCRTSAELIAYADTEISF